MNTYQDSSDRHDLDPLLASAVQAVLAGSLASEAIARVTDRAKRLAEAPSDNRPTISPARTDTRVARRLLVWSASSAAALAATLLLGLFLSSGATVSLAEMLAAVASRPWVHGTSTYSDGDRSVTSEVWVSRANHSLAAKIGQRRQFEDLETGILLQYDAKDGVIYRLQSLQGRAQRPNEGQLPGLLDKLIADKADPRDLFPGDRVVKAERHEEEQNGKEWLEYVIHLEGIGNAARNRTVRIRLDRATQLPQLWEERTAKGGTVVTRIDYPDSGPQSIYELGVPKTATLIDRVPKGDLALIIAAQRADRRRFDAYDAIVVQQTEGLPTRYDSLMNLAVKRVRRTGEKYRVDVLLIAKPGLVVPGPETDMQQWWKENRDRFWSVPQLICDGKTTHFYKMEEQRIEPDKEPNLVVAESMQAPIRQPADDSPAEWTQLMPDQSCRPHLWPADKSLRFAVDAEAKDGPEGTVRVVVTQTSKDYSGERYRYWFDPVRDYVLQKEISTVFKHLGGEVAYLDTAEYDEFAQSPRGKWYPQRIRRITSDHPNWHGVTRFYVDFETKMGDDLFRLESR